ASEDLVVVQFDQIPSIAVAGPDQNLCTTNSTLEATIPAVGTGEWSILSNPDGLGVINDPFSPSSTFSGSAEQTYILRWTVSNGPVCLSSSDDITIAFGPDIPAPIISGATDVCIGEQVTYTIPGGNPALFNYIWDISSLPASTDVIPGSGSPYQFITLQINEPFNAALSVIQEDKKTGCQGSAGNVLIMSYDIPDITLTSSASNLSQCLGEEITFTATDNKGVATSYEFLLNGVTVQSGPSPQYITSVLPEINSVVAIGYTNKCPSLATPPISILIHPLPNVYNVTGGGEICLGYDGLPIGLNSSDNNVNYKLIRNGVILGIPLVGTGGAINFPPQNAPGLYTIIATTENNCVLQMNGETEILVKQPPTAFKVNGGGDICEGSTGAIITLNGSENGINYQLWINNNNTGASLPGTGTMLSFGYQTAEGTYEIKAINPSSGCEKNMSSNAKIKYLKSPQVIVDNTTPEICSGSTTQIHVQADDPTLKYTWSITVDDGIIGAVEQNIPTQDLSVIAQQLNNISNQPKRITYHLLAEGACAGNEENIQVVVNPLPGIQLSGNENVCLGETARIQFDSQGSAPFSITYTDGTSTFTLEQASQTEIITVSPEKTTTYSVINIIDNAGCTLSPTTATHTLNIDQTLASFEIPSSSTGCGPLEVLFRNTNIREGVDYTWSWGDGSNEQISSDEYITHTFINNTNTSSLSFKVTLTAINTQGLQCESVFSETIKVLPEFNVAVTPDITEGCGPLTVVFSNNSIAANDHLWYYRLKGSMETIEELKEESPSFLLNNNTSKSLTYEVVYEGSNGFCHATVITDILVYPEINASFRVNDNETASSISLENQPHAIIENRTANNPGWSYSWEYGNGDKSSGYDPLSPYNYGSYGDYPITLTVSEPQGNCSDDQQIVLRVVPVIPVIDFDATPLEGCRPL
ncbi:MAG: PKD domain-containing protein, partial [Cyclobacteriaceae bacterium]|nr:PKD domain-containing protein [Cyclobacteriaceae bacterium]